MLRIIVLALCLALADVVLGSVLKSDQPKCEVDYADVYPSTPCNGGLSTDSRCNNSFLKIANTSFYTCSNVSIFWNYPRQNLTIIVESSTYTKLKQPFKVSFKTQFSLPLYRIYPNGQEILISNTTAEYMVQNSDKNYQVVVKYQGPEQVIFYGAYIKYEVTRA